MANLLNEDDLEFVKEDGRDIHVINKKIKIEVGTGSTVFEIFLWLLFIIPGLVFWVKKIGADNYFNKLEQRIQTSASEIDNYMEQRVQILTNMGSLVSKSIELDKETFTQLAALRSGINKISKDNSEDLSEFNSQLNAASRSINVAIENYPELLAHNSIQKAMRDNDYTQREITAARSNYNDLINRWNNEIQVWPTHKIVASKKGLTTRIPFIADKETKEKARSNFFN